MLDKREEVIMVIKLHPKEPVSVACEICLEEIPRSVSASHEADEYAQHFCGIECYTVWKAEQESEQVEDNNNQP